MRYHDFHLSGYSVSDYGGTITLNLVYGDPDTPKTESYIEFSKVEAYHFIHTGGAIITDIREVPIATLLDDVYERLVKWYHMHGGYGRIEKGRSVYQDALEADGYHAWILESAVGFEGFVIAEKVEQKALIAPKAEP